MIGDGEHGNRAIQEFLNSDFDFRFSAGECNFLMQVLAFIVQENPRFVPQDGDTQERERLNYQSLRSLVLLNEKLNKQLQQKATEASVILGAGQGSDRVQ